MLGTLPAVAATYLQSIHTQTRMRMVPHFRRVCAALYSAQAQATPSRVKLKLPVSYNPYGSRPPPSDKILRIAQSIAELSPEERYQLGPALHKKVNSPQLEIASDDIIAAAAKAPTAATAADATAKADDKKAAGAEKTTFNVKLDKFDAAAKIKVIKEVRAFTNLGLKEAKELVEKSPVILKQGVTKEEANEIIEKIKAAGGVAVME